MAQLRKPVSFIATSLPEKATVFYRDVLGLTLVEASQYALVFADGDSTLRVQIVAEFCPAAYTAHGWQVTDIEEDIVNLAAQGVELLMFKQLPQDNLGVWTTPDGNKIAWFNDPCGNVLSLTQHVSSQLLI